MTLKDYLLISVYNGAYKNTQWVISVLSIIDPDSKFSSDDVVPYQAIRTSNGTWGFYDPIEKGIVGLEGDLDFNFPILTPDTVFDINPGEIVSVKEPIKTTFGCILANCYYLIDVVGDRIPFINKEFDGKLLRGIYTKRVYGDNDPRAGELGNMSVAEMHRSIDNGYALAEFSSLCVPSACPETMYPPKFIIELRDRLFEEHKDELSNPVVMGRIQDQILKEYKAYLMKTPSAKFFVGSKTINQAFNKMFITGGIETSFGGNTVVKGSLYEGWDLSVFPALCNNSIEGSYDRGASTADGGKKVKDIIRVTQNILVSDKDCGTKVGIPWVLTEVDIERTVGSYAYTSDNKMVLLSEEVIRSFIGEPLIIRSPVCCDAEHGDSCPQCAGDSNSKNPRGISSGSSKIGSNLMIASLKGMHKGSKIDLVKYDLDLVLS